MSKHTPGPWLQSGTMIMAQQRRHLMVAHCAVTYVSGLNWTVEIDRNEAIENACLIAAAPDLLAALKEAVEIIEKHVPRDALGVDHMGDFSVPGGVMTWGVLDEHLHYMRKAIAKAEGRS